MNLVYIVTPPVKQKQKKIRSTKRNKATVTLRVLFLPFATGDEPCPLGAPTEIFSFLFQWLPWHQSAPIDQ